MIWTSTGQQLSSVQVASGVAGIVPAGTELGRQHCILPAWRTFRLVAGARKSPYCGGDIPFIDRDGNSGTQAGGDSPILRRLTSRTVRQVC
jgi:hypothetical protein